MDEGIYKILVVDIKLRTMEITYINIIFFYLKFEIQINFV
jgi:hypothetical protein